MKKLRFTALLLALMMAVTTACGGDDGEKEDTKDASGTTPISDTDSDTETSEAALEIPDNLSSDYKTITILTAEGILSSADELTEDMDELAQANFERTSRIEERFGIDLEFVKVVPWQDTQNLARQSINSQSDDYQMIFTCATHQINLVNEGLYLPLDELPYIDIDKPWWNKQYIESVSLVEGDYYILFGDITYNTTQRTACVFFNVRLLDEKLGMEPQELYDLVYDGEWTIDKFTELVSQVYEDDGDTVNDIDDIHGLTYLGGDPFNWMAFSAGIKFTDRDEDGYPVLNVNTETTVDLLDKLCKLFFNNQAVYKSAQNPDFAEAFGAGKSLFMVNRFFMVDWQQLRDMNDDYGILPMPKYDENIDGYHSTVEGLVQWGAVPVTVADPLYVSAVAEALAYESRELVTPAYYDNSLKLKRTRDEESIKMIELIMEGRDTDYLFINPLGGMGNIFKDVWSAAQNNFSSLYASREPAAQQALQDLIDTYEDRQ